MSAKHFVVDSKADKSLSKIPRNIRSKIIERLSLIEQNPLVGIKLGGRLSDYYKCRVGDYRIIYSFDSKKSLVFIAKIEHRQGVYR